VNEKKPLGFHLLHVCFPLHIFLAGIDCVPSRDLSLSKRAVELYAELFPELLVVGDGTPHARNRRAQFNLLFNGALHVQGPFIRI
jgi:hypothetical protein